MMMRDWLLLKPTCHALAITLGLMLLDLIPSPARSEMGSNPVAEMLAKVSPAVVSVTTVRHGSRMQVVRQQSPAAVEDEGTYTPSVPGTSSIRPDTSARTSMWSTAGSQCS